MQLIHSNTDFHHHHKHLHSQTPPEVAIHLCIISNIAAKGKNYMFTSRNMKQSARYGTLLQFYRNKLYVQTDSCKLWNTKPDDRDSGFCSNTAVGHQTIYQLFSVSHIRVFKR
jgi:hypothetical protein